MSRNPSRLLDQIVRDPAAHLGLGLQLVQVAGAGVGTCSFRDELGRLHFVAVCEGRAEESDAVNAARTAGGLAEPDTIRPRAWLCAREVPTSVEELAISLGVHVRDFPGPVSPPVRQQFTMWPGARRLPPGVVGYHVTAIENLRSILLTGLQSRRRLIGRWFRDLSSPVIQERRARQHLHDRVPLFLHPRNPMLYRLIQEVSADAVAIIELRSGAAVFTLRGRPGHALQFPDDLSWADARAKHEQLMAQWPDWDLRSWLHPDPDVVRMRKSLLQAEMHVLKPVPPWLIKRIYVATEPAAQAVLAGVPARHEVEEVVVQPDLFFQSRTWA